MTNTLTANALPALQTCRGLHQTWATTLARSEDEIDQLLSLLADLPTNTGPDPRHVILSQAQALNHLKATIHRLRLDVVCSGAACASPRPATTCPDERFTQVPTNQPLIASVSDEYNRLKYRCQNFLGELMRLNLI